MSPGSVSYILEVLVWAALAGAIESVAVAIGWAVYARWRHRRAAKSSWQALHVLFMIAATTPVVSAVVIHWLTRQSHVEAYEGANHRSVQSIYAVDLVNTQHWIYHHLALCLTVWFCITILLLLRLVRVWLTLRQNRCIAGPASLQEEVGEVSKQLCLSRVPVALFSEVDSPFVANIRAPRIVLPAHILRALSPDELRAVLLHEAAHIAHYDLVWNAAQLICLSLCWWNLGLWLLFFELRQVREFYCDETALNHTSPSILSRALVALLEMRSAHANAVTLSAVSNNLRSRIETMYRSPHDLSSRVIEPYVLPVTLWLLVFCAVGLQAHRDPVLKRSLVISDFGPLVSISARDDQGVFKVQLKGGHVLSVALDGRPPSDTHFSQVKDEVLVRDTAGKPLLQLRVDPGGAMTWQSRPTGHS